MGGQGDILSGLIATFLAWGKAYEENVWKFVFILHFLILIILSLL